MMTKRYLTKTRLFFPFLFMTLMLCADGVAQSLPLPFTENFEGTWIGGGPNDGTHLWTKEFISGTTDWVQYRGGLYIHPYNHPTNTSFNALFYREDWDNPVSRLISPPLDTSGYGEVTLSFRYCAITWLTDQDYLSIEYRDNPSAPWVYLTNALTTIMQTSVTNGLPPTGNTAVTPDPYFETFPNGWANVTFILPTVSTQCCIAFRGYSDYGYGICVDDVSITGTGGGIALSTNALSYTATFNASNPKAQTVEMSNVGVSGFSYSNTVSYSSEASGWLSVSPVSGSVGFIGSVNLTNSITTAGMWVGTYYATNVISSADSSNAPQSYVVSLSVDKALQTISFPNPGQQIVTNVTAIAATSSSGLNVSLEVVSGPAILSDTNSPATLTYTDPGMVTLRATQLGDSNWGVATAEVISFRAKIVGMVPCDFDGDGMSDLSVYWPEVGNWYIRHSGGGANQQNWGWSATVPVPGDYDGDGITDLAVYWPDDGAANWFVLQSSDSLMKFGGPVDWGWSVTVPVSGDYDGDGMTDLAVYWPESGNWYIRYSGGGTHEQNWGWDVTVPVPGDYDGDGLADLAVYWPDDGAANWFILQSSDSQMKFGGPMDWGWSDTVPVPGDYDGDGMTDLAVYWPEGGKWYIKYSSGGTREQDWGWSETVPVPGDYDGDGTTDLAVYWPYDGAWNWFILQSSDGQMKFGGPVDWGWSGTYPTSESYWLHWF